MFGIIFRRKKYLSYNRRNMACRQPWFILMSFKVMCSCVALCNYALGHYYIMFQWFGLVGCFGFNGPLRQYFSLYRAVSRREGERGEKG